MTKTLLALSKLLLLLLWTTTTTKTADAAEDPSLRNVYDAMTVEMDPSDYTIHDPSRIVTVGKHQLIAVTGKAQEDGYDCGLETWWRKKGSDEWLPGQCLFRKKPSWVSEEAAENDGAFWAPELDLTEDGRLTLLYSVSEMHDDGPNTCVGIATSKTGLAGFPNELEWEDAGKPMFCIDGGDHDVERSAIDPSVFRGMGSDKGRLFLVTGGGYILGSELDPDTYQQKDGEWFEVGSDHWTELARGPRETGGSAGSGDDDEFYDWVEAAYVHPNPDTGYYYLFANWGHCCRGTDSTYEIRVGRSKNPMGPYLDKKGNDMMTGGGTVLEKSRGFVVGPGHTGIWSKNGKDHISFHYYDKRRGGNSWIAEKKLKWKKGWPKTGKKVLRPFPKSMLD